MRSLLLARVALLASSQSLGAQVTTLVSGRILAAGAPVTAALVSVSSFERDTAVGVKTSADGRYEIRFPRAPQVVIVSVELSGYVTQFRQLPRPASGELKVTDFELVPRAQTIAAMRAVAPRPRPPVSTFGISPRPGERADYTDPLGPENLDLTGDLSGELMASLIGTPGVAGGRDGFSFAGLASDQNQQTVNGAEYKGKLPREALLMRAAVSSYDPATGGGGVQMELYPVKSVPIERRRLRLTADPTALQRTGPGAAALGTRSSTPVVSGLLAGPVPGDHGGYSLNFQGNRSVRPFSTLLDLDEGALRALNLEGDSVRRVIQLLPSLRIPAIAPNAPGAIARTEGSFLLRYDPLSYQDAGAVEIEGTRRMTGAALDLGRSLWFLVGGDFSTSEGVGIGPSSTTLSSTTSGRHALNVRGLFSDYFRESFRNETRVALDVEDSRFVPLVAVPGASILMSSRDSTGNDILSSARVGGSGTAITRTSSMSANVANHTRWMTRDLRFTPTISLEASVNSQSFDRGANLGTYLFNSIADFAGNTPASFTRALDARTGTVKGMHAAVGVGSVYAHSKRLAAPFGVREEFHAFDVSAPSRISATSSAGSNAPALAAFSPMAGFSWYYGTAASGWIDRRYRIYGGVRDYRELLPTSAVAGLLASTDVGTRLECLGASVPTPDWGRFIADSASVPRSCSGGSTALASSALSAAAFSKDFSLGHSWRSELGWEFPIAQLSASISGMFAINTAQPEFVDANFNPVVYTRLADERDRPVFVPVNAIAPSTGVASIASSRIDPSMAFYTLRTATEASRSATLAFNARYAPPARTASASFPVTFAYFLNDVRTDQGGFASSTAGDPRDRSVGPARFNRHTVQVTTQARVPAVGIVGVGLQVLSGSPFTPLVAGDINGDGYSNDRAFVFDPARTADTAVNRAMSSLLASGSGAAECLRHQLGTIAASGTCTGPWTTSVNASFTFDALRLHMPNRGSLTLRFANLAGLADRVLHGESGLRGWGPGAFPDPILLSVRGFDPVQRRFAYVVNPHFGDGGYYQRFFGSPFRVSIDGSINLGPNTEQWSMRSLFRRRQLLDTRDRDSVFWRLKTTRGPVFQAFLDYTDQKLTPTQVSAITRLGDVFEARRDSALRAYADFVVSPAFQLVSAENASRWRELCGRTLLMQNDLREPFRAILTPDQAREVFDHPANVTYIVMGRQELAQVLTRWVSCVP